MSRLIVTEFITLDGVMEAPGGEPGHPHAGWDGMPQYVVSSTLQAPLAWQNSTLLEGDVAA